MNLEEFGVWNASWIFSVLKAEKPLKHWKELLCADAHPTLVGDLKELWRNLELIIPPDIIIQILLLFLADLLSNFEELLPSLFLRRGICALKFLRCGICALKFLRCGKCALKFREGT